MLEFLDGVIDSPHEYGEEGLVRPATNRGIAECVRRFWLPAVKSLMGQNVALNMVYGKSVAATNELA